MGVLAKWQKPRQKGQPMKISVKTNVTINNPIFVPIEDGDYGTVKFYEDNGYPVRTVNLNGVSHLYAVIEGESEEQAKMLNRKFNAMKRKDSRDLQRRRENETSYEGLVDEGYDAAVNSKDPSEIALGLVMAEELFKEVKKLSDEKRKICYMVANDMTEREIAETLGIAQTTLHGRKVNIFEELKNMLQ